MPISKPARMDLYYTRGSTYEETFDFPGRAAEINVISVQMVIKRRDSQESPELLRLIGVLSVDPTDNEDALIASFSATPAETARLPSGVSSWALETREAGGIVLRQIEGRLIANE